MREYRILHLEDSSIDADLIKISLQKAGLIFQYSLVDTEENFRQGIEEFKPNVILCDHVLPQFDSIMALEIYHQMNLEIPFILVTGNVSEEYAVEMMKKGIDDYLLKVNLQRLPQAIEKAFSKREKESIYKLAKEKLVQSELLLNKAQQIAHIGSWEASFATQTVLFSDEACRIYGFLPEEKQHSLESWMATVHPEDIAYIKGEIEKSNASLSDTSFSHRIICRDGKVKHIDAVVNFILNHEGKPIGIYGIVHDVTEKKKAEEKLIMSGNELRHSEVNLKQAQAISHVGNWEFDFANETSLWSDEACRIYGLSLEKNKQSYLSWLSFIHPEDLNFVKEKIKEGKNPEQRSSFHYRIRRKDGTIRHIYLQSYFEYNTDGKTIGIYGVAQDVTEQKIVEQEILQKNEQLQNLTTHLQHIREEERRRIAREIHDELGQQLTAFKMGVDWVLHKQTNTEGEVAAKLNELLKMSDTAVNAIRRISSDLRPAIIDDLGLIPALEGLCNDLNKRGGITCHFISSVKERKFEDTFSINTYRIVQEGLTNVVRHAQANSVTVSLRESATAFILEITDDGKGISEEDILKSKHLGIIGMKERAALLGGKLTIEGTKNKGTRTKLVLPLKNN